LLSVNDKISNYLNETPEHWKDVTIHHLLTHSSGIPDYSEDSLWLTTRSCGTSFHQTVSLFRNKKLLFSPGAKYNYSNSGYVLLGYIIEKLSGKSFNQFIAENIFKPLQIKNSFVDDNKIIIPHRARGYIREGLELYNFPYLNMEIGKSAGGIISTTEDLLKWDQFFYTNRLLSQKSKDAMFTIYVGDYGYGWHMDSLNGAKRSFHSGGILGYKTNIDRYTDYKLTIIILCNSYDGFINSAIKDLGAIALNKPYKLPEKRKSIALPVEKLKLYLGIYRAEDGQVFTIRQKKDHLEVELNQKVYNLFAETEMNFFSDEYDAQIMVSFSGTPAGQSLLYNKKLKAVKL
jgi:CubicO group peptidase (beta-lactamase class C family)